MRIVNETQQEVNYGITSGSGGDCGTLGPNDYADWPAYDNQENVTVSFNAAGDSQSFQITVDDTHTGEQVEMAVIAE
jgi:hypothetical protein